MPEQANISNFTDAVYIYDGSLEGFFCCVYESVYGREVPSEIVTADEAQPTMFSQKFIETCSQKASRVSKSIPVKICARAMDVVETVFLSCMKEKELSLLQFLLLGYKQGPKIMKMLGHPIVAPVLAAERHLHGECHLLLGFIRFSDYDGVLGAQISPKNFVLPFIAGHFISRFPKENFIIFDKTHKAALLYQDREKKIVPLEGIEFPQENENEKLYQQLWKQFYNTVSIEARYNPKGRMTHMPKRYWENMTEMKDHL